MVSCASRYIPRVLAGLLHMCVLVGLSACVTTNPPPEIIVGKMGRVLTEAPLKGSRLEGRSLAWALWNATAMVNGFQQSPSHIRQVRSRSDEIVHSLASFQRTRNAVFWIGHSTFLLKIDGLTILTDPIFATRASPVSLVGPRRYIPPALTAEALPPVDVIMISHNHYDHFDVSAINTILRNSPRAVVLVPAKSERLIERPALGHVRGFLPGESITFRNVSFTAFPAYHVSSRFGLDASRSPALSWSIRPKVRGQSHPQQGAPSVFFAGDTAYGPLFSRITNVYGAHDVALVPIGAYAPRKREQHAHVNPEEALTLARDLGVRLAIPMHWGTFPLSDEPVLAPVRRFMKAAGPPRIWLRVGEVFNLEPASSTDVQNFAASTSAMH